MPTGFRLLVTVGVVLCFLVSFQSISIAEQNGGFDVTTNLWAKAVLKPSSGHVTLQWQLVGSDITPSGAQVVSGYFYADPAEFAYGSIYNPEVFVKIYIDPGGWCNIAFNHVTVDDVDVYTAQNYQGGVDQTGTLTLSQRLDEHTFNGVSIDTSIVASATQNHNTPSIFFSSSNGNGYEFFSDLWSQAIMQVAGNPVNLVWKRVGSDTTPIGARVVSGYFYADPAEFAYGSIYNPEVFVKIYIDPGGWCNIAFNHVTVDDVSISSAHKYTGAADQNGLVTLSNRLTEQQYDGVSTDPSDDDTEAYISLKEGVFWEYYWSSRSTSGSQDSGSSNSDAGSFKVTLGAMQSIYGIDAYPLVISGKTTDSDGFQYSPEFTYIAISGSQLLGSTDGANWKIIFDDHSSQWIGGGFFTDFGTNTVKASSKSVKNDYIPSTSAIAVERSQSQSKCTYYSGIGQICPNDESFTISETEYYKDGFGPIAYDYNFTYSNDGGGYTTWRTAYRDVGLVDSSLSSEQWEPVNPPWVKKSSVSSSIASGYSAAEIDGIIYLTGGNKNFTRYRTLNIYDPSTDAWSIGAAMPSGRSDHTTVAINGKLYIAGGYSSSETNTIVEYDPFSDSWRSIQPAMSKKRVSHVAAPIYDAMVILGGAGLSSVEFNYPGSGNSGTGENMPRQMNYMGGASSGYGDDQKIYLMGGMKYNAWNRSCNEAEYLSYCYRLDPFTWKWVSCRSMPTARADLSVVSLDDKLYAIGGKNCSGKTNVVEVYNPTFNSWTSVSPMLNRASNTTAVTVNGKIYAFYGEDGKIHVEEYDPKRDD